MLMKLKPETAEEITDCATPDGMRRRLQQYAYRGGEPMVKVVFDMARYRGLSGEDMMTVLAFEALKGLEHINGLLLKEAMLSTNPVMLLEPAAHPSDQDTVRDAGNELNDLVTAAMDWSGAEPSTSVLCRAIDAYKAKYRIAARPDAGGK